MILNSTKIILPTARLIKFYWYFSYATLIACWILSPFIFYIILTQSKNLKTFKWLIANHCFWCLILETILAIVKPVFALPSTSGIHIGIFREIGDFRLTVIFAILCFSSMSNCIIGLTATIGSRHMLVFPSPLTAWFNLKISIIGMASAIVYGMLLFAFWPTLIIEKSVIHQWAMEYDGYLEIFFGESSFVFFPPEHLKIYCILILVFLIFLVFVAGAFLIFFMILACKFKSQTAAKFKFSLIMSSIVQVFITGIMLVFPTMAFFVFIIFDIGNSATVMCVSFCVILGHCLVEFAATIYFILPYRKFVSKIFFKIIFRKKDPRIVKVISLCETSRIFKSLKL